MSLGGCVSHPPYSPLVPSHLALMRQPAPLSDKLEVRCRTLDRVREYYQVSHADLMQVRYQCTGTSATVLAT